MTDYKGRILRFPTFEDVVAVDYPIGSTLGFTSVHPPLDGAPIAGTLTVTVGSSGVSLAPAIFSASGGTTVSFNVSVSPFVVDNRGTMASMVVQLFGMAIAKIKIDGLVFAQDEPSPFYLSLAVAGTIHMEITFG